MEVLQLLMHADNIMFMCTRRSRKQPVHTGNGPNVPLLWTLLGEKRGFSAKGHLESTTQSLQSPVKLEIIIKGVLLEEKFEYESCFVKTKKK